MSFIIPEDKKIIAAKGKMVCIRMPRFIDEWALRTIIGYPQYILSSAITAQYIRSFGMERYKSELKKEVQRYKEAIE